MVCFQIFLNLLAYPLFFFGQLVRFQIFIFVIFSYPHLFIPSSHFFSVLTFLIIEWRCPVCRYVFALMASWSSRIEMEGTWTIGIVASESDAGASMEANAEVWRVGMVVVSRVGVVVVSESDCGASAVVEANTEILRVFGVVVMSRGGIVVFGIDWGASTVLVEASAGISRIDMAAKSRIGVVAFETGGGASAVLVEASTVRVVQPRRGGGEESIDAV